MKRTFLSLLLAVALLPLCCAQAARAAGEPIVLTLNLGMPPIHQRWVKAIKPWCEELKRRSNGRIRIEPYFVDALGKRADAMDSVRTGIADMAEAPFSSNPGAFPFHSQIFSAANPSMALGATVVGMKMSDLYQALQGGIVDGIVMDFDPLISRRYGEGVKYATLLNITGTAFYMVMNQGRYDSLPDDLKAVIDDMAADHGPKLLEAFWAENVYGSLRKWIDNMGGTVYALSDEDYVRADKMAEAPMKAWFRSLGRSGYDGEALEKTFHELEDKYFTPWRRSEAYRFVRQ